MHKIVAVFGMVIILIMAALWLWAYSKRRQIMPFLFLGVIASIHVVINTFSVIAAFSSSFYFTLFVDNPRIGSGVWIANSLLVALNASGLIWLARYVISISGGYPQEGAHSIAEPENRGDA